MLDGLIHLIDPPRCGWPALELHRGLAGRDGDCPAQRTVLIGGTSADASARLHGISARDRIAAPLGQPLMAAGGLKRVLTRWPPPSALVAWSAEMVLLARAAGSGLPIVSVITMPPPRFDGSIRHVPIARALLASTLVVYPSEFLRDSWVARFTLLGCPAAVIAPGPARGGASVGAAETRAELRKEWRIGDETILIAALGEPMREVDAHAAVFAAGVLGVAGRSVAAVVHSGSSRLDRALRFAANIRPQRRVIVDDRPPPELLPAIDLALWSEPDSELLRGPGSAYTCSLGAVSLAWAAALGVPVVAHEHPSWRSVLGDWPGAVAVPDRSRLALTQAILRALRLREQGKIEPMLPREGWGDRFLNRVAAMLGHLPVGSR